MAKLRSRDDARSLEKIVCSIQVLNRINVLAIINLATTVAPGLALICGSNLLISVLRSAFRNEMRALECMRALCLLLG